MILVAIVVQGIAANVTNVYTSGLSIVNSAPRLGRFRATLIAAAVAVGLSALPDFVNHAQNWITHLGNVARAAHRRRARRLRARSTGGGSTCRRCSTPPGRYRYLNGVNVSAVVAVAVGVGVYYALPQASMKVAVGDRRQRRRLPGVPAARGGGEAAPRAGRGTAASNRSSSSG